MKTRHQASGIRHQSSRRGFTLIEVLLAVSISVMVFFAMGSLLSKCFMLWKDAMANWRLAQYTRVARARILSGGFANPPDGLLAATNVNVYVDGGWDYIEYVTVASSGVVERVYGWGSADDSNALYDNAVYGNILLKRGNGSWAFAQAVANFSYSYDTPVKTDSFAATVSNDMVQISYRMKFTAAGKTFTQPHTISARLVNKE